MRVNFGLVVVSGHGAGVFQLRVRDTGGFRAMGDEIGLALASVNNASEFGIRFICSRTDVDFVPAKVAGEFAHL